jgi:hypothetical protein
MTWAVRRSISNFAREKLASMAGLNDVTGRGGVEPHVHITPDEKWVVLAGSLLELMVPENLPPPVTETPRDSGSFESWVSPSDVARRSGAIEPWCLAARDLSNQTTAISLPGLGEKNAGTACEGLDR